MHIKKKTRQQHSIVRGEERNRVRAFDENILHQHHFDNSNNSKLSATSSAPPDSGGDDEWTKSRIHNKSWFRSVALMLAIGLIGCATPNMGQQPLPSKKDTLYLLSTEDFTRARSHHPGNKKKYNGII